MRRGAAAVAAVVLVLVAALYFLAPRILQLPELGLFDEHLRLRGARAGDHARLAAAVAARLDASAASPTARYRRALAAYLTDRHLWHPAIAEWDVLLAESSADAGAHFARAVALDGTGDAPAALDAYRLAAKLEPSNVTYRLRFAARLWESEQFYQAINEWRTAVDLAPGNVEARLGLARAWVRVGERVEGFREYQRVLEVAPGQPDALRELARLRGY